MFSGEQAMNREPIQNPYRVQLEGKNYRNRPLFLGTSADSFASSRAPSRTLGRRRSVLSNVEGLNLLPLWLRVQSRETSV